VEKPITTVAFEVAVIDWLPLARIPSWPGAKSPNRTRPKIRLQSDSCLQLTRIDNGHDGRRGYELTSLRS
jgi:hypothetical protein